MFQRGRRSSSGKLRFGAGIVNLAGDRTQPGGLATTGFDDEGVKTERWHLVRDGMFVDWQTTRELATLVGQQRPHGCLHADDWSSVPFPRMPNVSLEPASSDVTLDDLFSGIKRRSDRGLAASFAIHGAAAQARGLHLRLVVDAI